MESVRDVWEELQNRYGKPNGPQLFGIIKGLSQISQGNNSISTYFTKIKKVWAEIDAMGMNPNCSCPCKCGNQLISRKFQQDQRVIQVLVGLNDSFSIIRGNILMQKPLPDLATAYNTLIEEENQKEIRISPSVQENSSAFFTKISQNNSMSDGQEGSSSFFSKNSQGNGPRNNPNQGRNNFNQGNRNNNVGRSRNSSNSNSCTFCNKTGHNSSDCWDNPNNGVEAPFCTFCKKKGHLIENCFLLKGLENKKKMSNNVKGSDLPDDVAGCSQSNDAFASCTNSAGFFFDEDHSW